MAWLDWLANTLFNTNSVPICAKRANSFSRWTLWTIGTSRSLFVNLLFKQPIRHVFDWCSLLAAISFLVASVKFRVTVLSGSFGLVREAMSTAVTAYLDLMFGKILSPQVNFVSLALAWVLALALLAQV